MSNIVPFTFEGAQVRVVEIAGEPWFVAADVCAVLEIGNPSMAMNRLEEDEVTLSQIEGSHRPTNLISESGLYSLVLRSDKPQARPFRKWVTAEVLPSIRKTGRYGSQGPLLFMPTPSVVDCMAIAQVAAESLRASAASRILMFSKVAKLHGLPTGFLPDYTEEKVTRSLTDLLKEHGCGLTARWVNTVLVDLGLLEEKSRPGAKGETKRFKTLTEAGLKYGKNLISPQNERETQPHYYADTFPELMDRVHEWMRRAAA